MTCATASSAALIGQVAPSVTRSRASVRPSLLLISGQRRLPDWTLRAGIAMVTEQGGPTSHSAIIARSLGIPAVVGARQREPEFPTERCCSSMAPTGELIMDPITWINKPPRRFSSNPGQRGSSLPGGTAHGRRVALLANIALESTR